MGLLGYIEVNFDPFLRIGELAIRWQTVGVAVALIVGVAMAARGRAQPHMPQGPDSRAPSRHQDAPGLNRPTESIEAKPLRLDDMAFVLLAAMPGAVVGGRLVHGLVFWEAYAANPDRLLDPAFGSLSLLGAVLGAALSAAFMARLLGAPVRRWADAGAVPLLVTLGLGKLAQFLGGSGQGLPSASPWAVAFTGEGPWVSANPSLPAHAAQVYEGLWLVIGALFVVTLGATVRARASGRGGLFVAALGIFLLGRLVVGFSWRDQSVLGPLNAEQLLALAAFTALLLGVAAVVAGLARYRGGVMESKEAARSREERRR